jgi:proteasome lid subunit RPN8/RPN11
VWLTRAQAQAIVRHARADFPREACGLLVGRGDRVVEVIPVANAATDPLRAYVMEPRALASALSRLDPQGLELIAFYHSHPHGDPIPSSTDKALATYPNTPYLIVGLKGGQARMSAWLLRPGQVDEVPLHVGDNPPPAAPRASRAQRVAILLSAIVAFILLIVVSLSLLPPAPPIPH